jgi:hypothetical protein
MPSFRRVSFSEQPEVSRLPYDDEKYVMRAFSKHASHCDTCYDPYQVYKNRGQLCSRGHQRALDVAQYVYQKGGQAYSLVDRERSQRVQIEIPAGCEPVRQLLKAMERGLLSSKRAPSSFDKNYFIPARPPTDRRRSSSSTKDLRLETVQPPSSPRPRLSRASSRSSRSPSPTTIRPALVRSRSTTRGSSRSPSPTLSVRPGLSRLGSVSSSSSGSHSRNNSYSSTSSRGSSPPSSRGSSRNSSVSSMSSYGSSRNGSISRDYAPKPVYIEPKGETYYKPSVFYRIKQEPPKSAPLAPPSDDYFYRRR